MHKKNAYITFVKLKTDKIKYTIRLIYFTTYYVSSDNDIILLALEFVKNSDIASRRFLTFHWVPISLSYFLDPWIDHIFYSLLILSFAKSTD